jgi:asparagine synthase (glutamine-hydrolysing)
VIDTAVFRNLQPDCAAFLSGGLDSSTVSGLLSVHQPFARTFSIGFDAKGYDETEYALITAKHFNTTHHVHYLQPEEIVDNFVNVATHFDEPFGNSSAMAAYICASVARQHGVSVMLAGDGGDEIFAGNERYAKQKVFELFGALPKPLQSLLDSVTHSPLGALPLMRKARSYVDQAKIPLPDRLDTYNFLNRFAPEQIFCDTFLAQVDTQAPVQAKRQRYQQSRATDPVDKMMYLDWKFTLADNDLVKVTSMCHKAGITVRYPLFEKEVVDFSCTVPADIKLPGNKLRDFYKNSFKGFLANETLNKAKHGFGLPFGVWMKEQPRLQQLTEQTLTALKSRQIVKPAFIDEALQIYRSGHLGYYGELIWIMVVLELWLQGWERNDHGA